VNTGWDVYNSVRVHGSVAKLPWELLYWSECAVVKVRVLRIKKTNILYHVLYKIVIITTAAKYESVTLNILNMYLLILQTIFPLNLTFHLRFIS
jgi:hypothetical protein